MPFFVPDNYSPEAIALAEGFQELGIYTFSNINYWFNPEENKFLLAQSDEEYEVGIYDYKYLYHSMPWTLNRIDKDKINILLDRNDWLIPKWRNNSVLNSFDFIFIDHMLKGFEYPKHVLPWSIGLTNRIIKSIDKSLPEKIPSNTILCNFRVGHNLRKLLTSELNTRLSSYYRIDNNISSFINNDYSPEEYQVHKSYWEQSARRHNPKFYEDLNNHLLTYAYGGYYEFRPQFYQPYSLMEKALRKLSYLSFNFRKKYNLDFANQIFVFQYDSFRFWEALYSATCPIHLDFESWGFILPVNPIEGIHYLGVKRLSFEEFEKRVAKFSKAEISQIGIEGRKWVYEHYSPKATAQRLLNIINK